MRLDGARELPVVDALCNRLRHSLIFKFIPYFGSLIISATWKKMGDRDKPINFPALGRPFMLGMLYDCRSDSLIPGVKLWDPDVLKKDVTTTRRAGSNFEMLISDTLADKSEAMDIKGELKVCADSCRRNMYTMFEFPSFLLSTNLG